MSTLFDLFKPVPIAKEIEDPEEIDRSYRYWRLRILYSMFIGYAFYYFTRKSFIFAMPGLISDLGFQKGQLGLLSSIFAISYGFSKFGSGILCDRSNARYFMAFGLIITGFVNIFFGFSSSIYLFAFFWCLNGLFQGFGWPPCARLLAHWYSQNERGSWWSTWNVSHNIGGLLIPWIAGACLAYFNWRWALYIPGVLCIGCGIFLIDRLRDTPQSIGLPTVEKWRGDFSGGTPSDENEKLSTKELLLKYVLKNKYIWMLAIAYFFVYIVRESVNNWTALFLIESKNYGQLGANGCVSLFEIGGFIGSLVAGWSSDWLFSSRRGPVNTIFALGMLVSVGLFWSIAPGHPFLDSCAIFAVGFFVFGPQMLIGMAAVELSDKKAAATASGFVGWIAYLGAACAGGFGKIAEDWGWEGFFFCILASSAVSFSILLMMWNVKEGSTDKVTIPTLDSEEPEYVA